MHVTAKQRCAHEVRYTKFIHLDNRDKRANNAKQRRTSEIRHDRCACHVFISPRETMRSCPGASPKTKSTAQGPWPPYAKARRRQHSVSTGVRHTRDGTNRNAQRRYAGEGQRKEILRNVRAPTDLIPPASEHVFHLFPITVPPGGFPPKNTMIQETAEAQFVCTHEFTKPEGRSNKRWRRGSEGRLRGQLTREPLQRSAIHLEFHDLGSEGPFRS